MIQLHYWYVMAFWAYLLKQVKCSQNSKIKQQPVCVNVTSVPCKLHHWRTTNYKCQSIDGCLKYYFGKNYMSRTNTIICMLVCTTLLYEFMNLHRNDVYNLFVNTHVRTKIYRGFNHGIIYIVNEGRHVRIKK